MYFLRARRLWGLLARGYNSNLSVTRLSKDHEPRQSKQESRPRPSNGHHSPPSSIRSTDPAEVLKEWHRLADPKGGGGYTYRRPALEPPGRVVTLRPQNPGPAWVRLQPPLTRPLVPSDGTPDDYASRVPQLGHGLQKVLNHPGVHPVLHPGPNPEPNLSPWLARVHHPSQVDFDAIPPFVTTSRDPNLHRMAVESGCPIKGSTSSVTSLLSQIYFHFSNGKGVNLSGLSDDFSKMPNTFTRSASSPVTVVARYRDGTYGIDSDSGDVEASNQVLLDLGKSLERMLTMTEEEYRRTILREPGLSPAAAPEAGGEAAQAGEIYSYMKVGDMCLRSQLDCYDPNLPGGIFEIKTRATAAVRIDVANYFRKGGYRLTRLHGMEQSYEREIYDLARSAFIKYGFQMRIGRMAGALLMHHNCIETFGFEYVPLKEVDIMTYGSQAMANKVFEVTTGVLNALLKRVTGDMMGRSFRLVLENSKQERRLHAYVEPLTEEADKGFKDNSAGNDYWRKDVQSSAGREALSRVTDPEPHKTPEIGLVYRSGRRLKPLKYSEEELAELIPISGTLTRYTVELKTFINNVDVGTNPFEIREGNAVEVFHKIIKDTATPQANLRTAYRRALKFAYHLTEKPNLSSESESESNQEFVGEVMNLVQNLKKRQ